MDGERIFEGALGSDGKVSVPVNNISADGHYLNFGIGGGISWYNNLYVISENPSMNFSIYVPDKVAIGSTIPVNVPDSEQATGIVFVYLDGDLKNTCIYREETVLSTEGLEIGNHTISVIYEGDDYFKPAQCNVTFEIVEHIITVPQTVIINQDDRAYVRLPADAAGTLKFYIDGKLLDEIDYVDDDYDEYGHVYVVDLSKCDVSKSHTLKVSFLGDSKYSKFTESYKFAMNFTFAFRLSDIEYSFGDENTVTIVCPYGVKSGFDILIDGVKFTKYEIEDYEETQVVVDISECAGTHDIAVDFKGNAKYSPLKVNTTFTVYPHIDYTYDNYYRDEGSVVKLLLPKDAKGNLVVEIDDKNYAKVPIANGQANVSFANLSLGYHNIKTYYDGADYEVENKSGEISIVGGIVINSNEFIYGDSLTVTLNLLSDANGTLKTSFNGVDKEVRMSNGSAKITYSNLKVGLFELYAQYVDNDEYGYSVNSISEGISTYPKLSISDKMVVFANNPVTLISNSGVEGQMEVELGDDSYYVNLKNGKAAYSLSKLTAGKHTIRVYFTNDDLYYDYGKFVINVAEAKNPKLTLASTSLYYGEASFKATLKGVDGKVLKNAAVIFKVNGKKVKTVKTNAKGIAVFKLTNLPKKYKVTATYGKVSQTKTVTVKRVLSLANTIVKKSANYAFLKATLKKGKTPIKNKVVVFKFNGKTFKAKTNAKGIAQVAVKKAFFYKLAVGKKIICQATYIKDTLKKVAIVRR